jgi:hypothetical protein
MPENETKNDVWAVAELMGHLTLAGRLIQEGELFRIDIPDVDTFRTEYFGKSAVYRIRITSEEIARAYALPEHAVVEYNAPIVPRSEYENAMQRTREAMQKMQYENEELKRRLVSVKALPEPQEQDPEKDTLG